MQKGISLGVILLALFSFQISFGQNNTSSPYTQFGIGDLTNKNFGWSNAIGGTAIARTARYANAVNLCELLVGLGGIERSGPFVAAWGKV